MLEFFDLFLQLVLLFFLCQQLLVRLFYLFFQFVLVCFKILLQLFYVGCLALALLCHIFFKLTAKFLIGFQFLLQLLICLFLFCELCFGLCFKVLEIGLQKGSLFATFFILLSQFLVFKLFNREIFLQGFVFEFEGFYLIFYIVGASACEIVNFIGNFIQS